MSADYEFIKPRPEINREGMKRPNKTPPQAVLPLEDKYEADKTDPVGPDSTGPSQVLVNRPGMPSRRHGS